ncbi:hypothetical protein Sjap_017497 [Stephania japonica]|uniref:catalase n=1 Tax=Stephania japonica TaxID=461633 RepID=A0AAP0I6A4_9MAGN
MVFFSPCEQETREWFSVESKHHRSKGFWRASTGEKKVRGCNGQLLGKRTSLNYYEGKHSKTDWIMQEYILAPPQDHRTPNKFEDYALYKIYQKGSKASTNKSSTKAWEEDYMVPQLPYYDQYMNVGEAQGGTINSEEAMPPLMIVNQDHPSALVPFVPADDNVANMGSVNNIASTSINCSSDHDHDVQDVHFNSFSLDFCDIDTEEVLETLIQAAFNSPDDQEPNAGVEVERMTTTKVAAADMDADVEEKLQCDFNTTHHHDVVALPNVESMVETTEVLEEEGRRRLRDFPQFEPADLEFSDWEADAWDNEFVLGNFDLVGNNFPVFFIRDGMKFPDMVHALKPNPKSHIQENWRVLDFFSHHPESLHMFTFLFDDIDQPAGSNHSHATQDLYDSSAAGNYPEWKLFIQIIDLDHEDKFDFDPLDVTKTWPEDILPLMPVDRMVLNKNVDNFFAENEQLAFCPGVIVPSVYYSDDKLLQTRVFSYSDIQRHRLGPNYLLLPANAPKCAHHNNHHEGFMNFMHRDEEVNYFPSRFDPVRHAETYPIPPNICRGKRKKCLIEKENNFKQPGERYRSFTPERQDRFIQRWVEALSDPRVTHEIRSIWARELFHESCLPWSLLVRASDGKGVVAICALEGKGGGGGSCVGGPDQLQVCPAGKEIEVHKSQVTTVRLLLETPLKKNKMNREEQEVDGEEAEQSK